MRQSILTDDLEYCLITKFPNVHIHHVFPGSRRKLSEKYGFIVPICPKLHTISNDSVHMNPNKGIDLMLKQTCQEWYEHHIGSREDFIREFGKNYI